MYCKIRLDLSPQGDTMRLNSTDGGSAAISNASSDHSAQEPPKCPTDIDRLSAPR